MKTRTCYYVKPNGLFCGSLALKGRDYCHFHLCYAGRRVRADQQDATSDGPVLLDLPPLEDANSIQIAVMQVMDAVLRRRISPRVSGQLLYALQIASSNLKLGVNFGLARWRTKMTRRCCAAAMRASKRTLASPSKPTT